MVNDHGDPSEKNQLRGLLEELQRAIDSGDPTLVRRVADDLDGLWFRVADRLTAFHVARFNHLASRIQSMRDVAQAEQLVAQGRKAINNDDVNSLKAANRQLIALLSQEDRAEVDRRIGDVI